MNQLKIDKTNKFVYRFLDLCRKVVKKYEEETYLLEYSGEFLTFHHPIISARLSITDNPFDLFEGLTIGLYNLRITPNGEFDLKYSESQHVTGYFRTDIGLVKSRSRTYFIIEKTNPYKASTITRQSDVFFNDDHIDLIAKFDSLYVYRYQTTNVLCFESDDAYEDPYSGSYEHYRTEIVFNPREMDGEVEEQLRMDLTSDNNDEKDFNVDMDIDESDFDDSEDDDLNLDLDSDDDIDIDDDEEEKQLWDELINESF